MSLFGKVGFNQTIFYQDVFHGGVTAGGFSTGLGVGSGTVDLYSEPSSTIRKAFIFIYSTGGNINDSILINGIYFKIKSMNQVIHFTHKNIYFSPIYIHCIDITDELNNLSTSSFLITIPIQPNLPYKGFFAPFIYIAYENPSLPLVNSNIILNIQRLIGNETYDINNLNPINTNNPVGFSIYTDRTAPYNEPNCNIYFNNNLLGIVGGSDNVNNSWSYAGVKGHFYFQNNQLFGLDDDSPDAIMSGTDGLADVSSYLVNNSTSCEFRLTDINYPNQVNNATDVNLAYFLSYTSPCDTFSVSVPSDTTICYGEQLQLNVSGGQQYEWTASTPSNIPTNPAPGLSCSNCPNPIFTGDSSMVYTVRIWNNDSCSVVRPVKISVNKPPTLICYTSDTQCGMDNGNIIATNLPTNFAYWNVITPAGDTLTNSIYYINHNLKEGTYIVYYVDSSGCRSMDTTYDINTYNNVVADFTVFPDTGGAPLQTQITNTSQNATHYDWSILTNSTTLSAGSGNVPTTTIFGTAGTYEIQLIAWDVDPLCADTISKTIFVYDSLMIEIPNVFTPNHDGINDLLTISVNLPVHCNFYIFNRWGNEMVVFDKTLTVGSNTIWDGNSNGAKASDGIYFYKAVFSSDNISPNLIKKQGFITLTR